MDPKSTAKSKRIHSQQGRKNHPSPSAAASKRQSSSAVSGGPHRREKLPSNWVRYEDDPDESVGNKGRETMVSVPSSKGADYGFLIDEARTQQKPISSSLTEELSFDFLHGSCSMLSSKGEALFNRCADDNFVVDDESSNYEVSSLTMDLKALAGQLSKLKMSQRLFLKDLLLPDDTKYHNKSEYKSEIRHGQLDIPTLSSAEPEIGFSDQVTIEMVQSLTSTSQEQENNNNNNNNNNINSQTGTGISNSSINKTTVLDESVDDLLEQNVMDVKRGNDTKPAKQVDDFDSWFDSL